MDIGGPNETDGLSPSIYGNSITSTWSNLTDFFRFSILVTLMRMAVEQIRFSSSGTEESDNEETLRSKSSSAHVAKVPVERRIDFMVVAFLSFYQLWCLTVHISIIYLCSLATNTGCCCVLHLSVGTILRILTVLSGNVGLVLNLQLEVTKDKFRRIKYHHLIVMILYL